MMEDLAAVLGPKLDVSRGDLNRSSLSLQTIRLPSQAERLAWLAEQLATLQGHGTCTKWPFCIVKTHDWVSVGLR